MRFANPEWLLLLLFIPVLIYRYIGRERRKSGRIRFSDTRLFRRIGPSFSLKLRHSLIAFRCVALALLIAAMARPQSGREGREILSQGIDIALAIDVSSSMKAQRSGGPAQDAVGSVQRGGGAICTGARK